MSIRDIFSNFKLNSGDSLFDIGDVEKPSATLSLPLGISTTTYFEVIVVNEDPCNIDVIEIRYTDVDGTDYLNDQALLEAETTADPGNLGNSIIDLNTGLPPVLPYNTDVSGDLVLAINIVNPLSFKNVVIVLNDTIDSFNSMYVNAFRGPLRFVAPKENS